MTDLNTVFVWVNDKRISIAAMLAMDKMLIKTLYANGCTALTSIDAPAAKTLFANGCTALTSIDAPAATTLDASGCTALTSIDALAATTLYASGCTALASIDAPAATYLYASGCTALTSIYWAGDDARGYSFLGDFRYSDHRVRAGCRNFSIAQALIHWGPGGPSDRPDCFAFVQKIAKKSRELAS